MRNVRPGSIQSAVQKSISAAGGLECASNDLGMSTANLSRASSDDEDRPGGLGINHLHRLGRIVPNSVVPIAQHFATLANGVFIPLAWNRALSSDLSRVTAEFADVMQVHAAAMSETSQRPHEYTPAEAMAARQEADELMAALAQYRAALDQRVGEQR